MWAFVHVHVGIDILYLISIRVIYIPIGTLVRYMRPETQSVSRELYECFRCGQRTDTGNTCDCGGELLHLGRSRDL